MKILVLGIPKTGTTYTYYLLKKSLPKDYDLFFEPVHHGNWHEKISNCDKVLVKDLFVLDEKTNYYLKTYSEFTKKISIVRDPRDRLISSLFFFFVSHQSHQNNKAIKAKNLRREIRKKIDDPGIPFIAILEELGFSKAQVLHNTKVYENYIQFLSSFDSIKIRYESLINGIYENLESYLGIEVTKSQIQTSEHMHVARTKSYGDWRNWFTPKDVVFFKNHYQDLLATLGYDDDWQLNENQTISQETTLTYLDKWSVH